MPIVLVPAQKQEHNGENNFPVLSRQNKTTVFPSSSSTTTKSALGIRCFKCFLKSHCFRIASYAWSAIKKAALRQIGSSRNDLRNERCLNDNNGTGKSSYLSALLSLPHLLLRVSALSLLRVLSFIFPSLSSPLCKALLSARSLP